MFAIRQPRRRRKFLLPSLLFVVFIGSYFWYTSTSTPVMNPNTNEAEPDAPLEPDHPLEPNLPLESKSPSLNPSPLPSSVPSKPPLMETENPPQELRDVHVFYYPWYRSHDHDGAWSHWNHRYLPHWDAGIRERYPHDVKHQPPDDIGADYYPRLGPYSSKDREVVRRHMAELRSYVIVVSWWGPMDEPKSVDGEGMTTDDVMPLLLEEAQAHGAKIAFHLEPYEGISSKSVERDLVYLISRYGDSPALYRDDTGRPVLYLYDSYRIPSSQWATLFSPTSLKTIRGTPHDFTVYGLYLDHSSRKDIVASGFDGFYTYFASDGFTGGSTSSQWQSMTEWARSQGLKVSISVGPGYVDTKVRPWNDRNTKDREQGQYYDRMWKRAIDAKPDAISITSYNEWHEGTQIEPSVPKTAENGITYLDFGDLGDLGPDYYMDVTKRWAKQFSSDIKKTKTLSGD